MENIIVAEGLRKEYDGFALEDVSFRVPGGAIMGLIGENGAGKTTTIKCLLNLVRRDAEMCIRDSGRGEDLAVVEMDQLAGHVGDDLIHVKGQIRQLRPGGGKMCIRDRAYSSSGGFSRFSPAETSTFMSRTESTRFRAHTAVR